MRHGLRALVIVPYFVLATLPLGVAGAHVAQDATRTRSARTRSSCPGRRPARAPMESLEVRGDARRLPQSVEARRRHAARLLPLPREQHRHRRSCRRSRRCVWGRSAPTASRAFAIPGRKDWLFFILSTRFLPPLAVVVPVAAHVPLVRAREHAPRADPALHELQPVARGLADEGLHRRDPARVRGGGAGRRLLAPRTPSCASSCRRRRRAWP